MRAQAEEEDLALVRAAAAKLAAALREVRVLLGRKPPTWKREALARCAAKGWIRLQGDPLTDAQIFRVTAEGTAQRVCSCRRSSPEPSGGPATARPVPIAAGRRA
jgi:hypothetical protein